MVLRIVVGLGQPTGQLERRVPCLRRCQLLELFELNGQQLRAESSLNWVPGVALADLALARGTVETKHRRQRLVGGRQLVESRQVAQVLRGQAREAPGLLQELLHRFQGHLLVVADLHEALGVNRPAAEFLAFAVDDDEIDLVLVAGQVGDIVGQGRDVPLAAADGHTLHGHGGLRLRHLVVGHGQLGK